MLLNVFETISPMLIGAGLAALLRLIVLSIRQKDLSCCYLLILGCTVLIPLWNTYCLHNIERQDLMIGRPWTNAFWLMGPALYFFLKERLTGNDYKISDLIHLIPYTVHVLTDYMKWLDGYSLFIYSCGIWIAVSSIYLIKMISLVSSIPKRKNISAEKTPPLAFWGIAFICGFSYFILADIYFSIKILFKWQIANESIRYFEFFRGIYFLSLIIFFQFIHVSKKFNGIKQELILAENIVKAERLEQGVASKIAIEIEKRTNDERLFLDPDIDLRKLSEAVGVSPHDVSDTLNSTMDTNFYSFINNKRISYACDLLLSNMDRSIIDIAFDSGFNSKGAFYSAFKKARGITPSRYRQQEMVHV